MTSQHLATSLFRSFTASTSVELVLQPPHKVEILWRLLLSLETPERAAIGGWLRSLMMQAEQRFVTSSKN